MATLTVHIGSNDHEGELTPIEFAELILNVLTGKCESGLLSGTSISVTPYQPDPVDAHGEHGVVDRGCAKCGTPLFSERKRIPGSCFACLGLFAASESEKYHIDSHEPSCIVLTPTLECPSCGPTEPSVCGVGLPDGKIAVDHSMAVGDAKADGSKENVSS